MPEITTTFEKITEKVENMSTEISIVTTKTLGTTESTTLNNVDSSENVSFNNSEAVSDNLSTVTPTLLNEVTTEIATESMKGTSESLPSTDLNDLLASSTENIDKATHSTNDSETVSEKITTTTKTVTTVIAGTTESSEQINSITDSKTEEDSESLAVIPLKKSTVPNKKLEKKREDEVFKRTEDKKLHHHLENDIDDTNGVEDDIVLSKFKQTTSLKSVPEIMIMEVTEGNTNKPEVETDFKAVPSTTEKSVTEETISERAKVENTDSLHSQDLRAFSKCAAGQFQCINGTAVKDRSYCIPLNARCDSVDDCSDKSDEEGCESCSDNFQVC